MALTKEDLQAISELLQPIRDDIAEMKQKIAEIEEELQALTLRVTSMELHIENCTDKNIQLIAENFIELTNKLNKAIPAADKNLAYEVKVNYLVREVDILKKEVAELKGRIA